MNQTAEKIAGDEVYILLDEITLEGDLTIPPEARGIVLFAHGSGSSRHSPRNQSVARVLQEANLATLLVDLLTPEEEQIDIRTRHLRFDIGLLSERLVGISDWLADGLDTRDLRIGYFGASTGAAAALVAASERQHLVAAIVSRGGRPDLAKERIALVRAPTLFIVGENDEHVLDLNRNAFKRLKVEKDLQIVLGASHLFEEQGALEEVARLSQEWFTEHLDVDG